MTLSSQFRAAMPASTLLADVSRFLAASGWTLDQHLSTPLGPGIEWSRTLYDHAEARATLAPGQTGFGQVWELDAVAPPQGRRVTGC